MGFVLLEPTRCLENFGRHSSCWNIIFVMSRNWSSCFDSCLFAPARWACCAACNVDSLTSTESPYTEWFAEISDVWGLRKISSNDFFKKRFWHMKKNNYSACIFLEFSQNSIGLHFLGNIGVDNPLWYCEYQSGFFLLYEASKQFPKVARNGCYIGERNMIEKMATKHWLHLPSLRTWLEWCSHANQSPRNWKHAIEIWAKVLLRVNVECWCGPIKTIALMSKAKLPIPIRKVFYKTLLQHNRRSVSAANLKPSRRYIY